MLGTRIRCIDHTECEIFLFIFISQNLEKQVNNSVSHTLNSLHEFYTLIYVFYWFKTKHRIDFSCNFCSTFYTSCYGGWSMCIQQMSCTVILNLAIYFWMQIVTLELGTLVWRGPHLKLISWQNMLSLDGTEPQNCSLTVLSTLLQLMFGPLVASLVRLWPENPCFLEKIMFIS